MSTICDLKVLNLKVSYGEYQALTGVSFDATPGEMLGIIGPNGSGKSTLLRGITRVAAGVSGQVTIGGLDTKELSRKELAKKIAVVEQEISTDFDMTVEELISMGRAPYLGLFGALSPLDNELIGKAMTFTHTDIFAKRCISHLSGGEKQRVAIARALAQDTPVLFLDEPTSHLDIGNQIGLLQLIRALTREKSLTVVIVLHDLNMASLFCDRIMVLKEGKAMALGEPAEILTPDLIKLIYGIDSVIHLMSETGKPYMVALPNKEVLLP